LEWLALLREDPPMESDELDDGLLVGDDVQGVELDIDDLELALVLLQGGAVGAHQHHLRQQTHLLSLAHVLGSNSKLGSDLQH